MKYMRWLCLIGILMIIAGQGIGTGNRTVTGGATGEGEREIRELEFPWQRTLPGEVMDVAVDGNFIYLAVNESGLQILHQDTKQIVGSYNTSGLSYGVAVSGRYVFVADWDNGLVILDVIDPSDPVRIARLDTPGAAYKVTVQGSYAYVCDWHMGLAVIDISDPSDPVEVGRFSDVDHATDCEITGTYAFLVDWWGLRVIDVSNPTAPSEVGNLSTGGFAYGIDVDRGYAYVADDFRGLRIIDIQDPFNPTEVGNYILDDNALHAQIRLSDNRLYAYIAVVENGLVVLDVTDHENPIEVANLSVSGQSRRVHLRDDTVLLASGDNGLWGADTYQEPPEKPDPDYWLFFLIIPIAAVGMGIYSHIRGENPRTKPSLGSQVNQGAGNGRIAYGTPTSPTSHTFPPYHTASLSSSRSSHRVIGSNTILGHYFASHRLPLSLDEQTLSRARGIMERDVAALRSPADRFRLYIAMKQLSYLMYPNNEWLRDLFHNYRDSLKFNSYFEMSESPGAILKRWALPPGLQGNVHLDRDRDEIVERIRHADPYENFVIIGDPGVGKTALLFQVFDSYMSTGTGAILSGGGGKYGGKGSSSERRNDLGKDSEKGSGKDNRKDGEKGGGIGGIGKYHEANHIRLFVDDIPEERMIIQRLQNGRTRGLVVSAREGDWDGLPYDFQRMFTRLTIRNFSTQDFRQVCRNLLRLSSVESDGPTIDLLMDYANGSPIFVWTLLDQLRQSGQKKLSSMFIRENASRGMLNYIGDILQNHLRERTRDSHGYGLTGVTSSAPSGGGDNGGGGRRGGDWEFRSGGFHALAMMYFLATHMEGRRCSAVYFNKIAPLVSRKIETSVHAEAGMDPDNPGLVLSPLSISNDMIRFPHDFWADVVMGKGDHNPFSKDIILIREALSDTGYFEEAKRLALVESWELVLGRYRRNPGSTRDAILVFCESILSNFTVQELRELALDIETMREIAALYSHLPEGEAILTRIERVSPLATQKVIEIRDSVIMKSSIG